MDVMNVPLVPMPETEEMNVKITCNNAVGMVCWRITTSGDRVEVFDMLEIVVRSLVIMVWSCECNL